MSSARLIVFTRYPVPGQTKTRLIPTLGAEGAAKLQREMTEHTLQQVKELQEMQPLAVEVHFTGGTTAQMQEWLGRDWRYIPQVGGGLGEKLIAAFTEGEETIVIGIDCPQLTSTLLQKGFEQLKNNNLVLGPALDGGYYLIGLRQLLPELFTGINWGTSVVLQQTVTIAQNHNLKIHLLPLLQDIDRPEDLSIWEQLQN